MADDPKPEAHPLAKLDEPWRGDEHGLRLDAAREAGLDTQDLELDLFTEGFKAGMTVKDPRDNSIVLRGRTVLRDKQLRKSLRPTLRFLGVSIDHVAVAVDDGEFEIRVGHAAVEQDPASTEAVKVVLKLWLGFGLLGLIAWSAFGIEWLASLLWGGGLITGAVGLRRGVVSGRAMLAARLTVALALLAKEEKLILPPAKAGG
ncbi:hypothetical protein ACNOYE_23255 [Nannocystaceae bacterium ST9]